MFTVKSYLLQACTKNNSLKYLWSIMFIIYTNVTFFLVRLILNTQTLATLRATYFFVLMHSGIVYRLLCDAHTLLEPHRGTAAIFFFFKNSLSSFSTISFYVFVTLTVLFLGASLACVNNLKRQQIESCDSLTGHLSVTHPWRLYNLIVLKASLNPTKLKLYLFHFWTFFKFHYATMSLCSIMSLCFIVE